MTYLTCVDSDQTAQLHFAQRIAPDKSGIQKIFFLFSHENICEGLLMSTHNICFCREIRKILVLFLSKKTPLYLELYHSLCCSAIECMDHQYFSVEPSQMVTFLCHLPIQYISEFPNWSSVLGNSVVPD